eukprot:gene286-159_t
MWRKRLFRVMTNTTREDAEIVKQRCMAHMMMPLAPHRCFCLVEPRGDAYGEHIVPTRLGSGCRQWSALFIYLASPSTIKIETRKKKRRRSSRSRYLKDDERGPMLFASLFYRLHPHPSTAMDFTPIIHMAYLPPLRSYRSRRSSFTTATPPPHAILCKPKLLPIKSFSLERLEKLEKKIKQDVQQRREAERRRRQDERSFGSAQHSTQPPGKAGPVTLSRASAGRERETSALPPASAAAAARREGPVPPGGVSAESQQELMRRAQESMARMEHSEVQRLLQRQSGADDAVAPSGLGASPFMASMSADGSSTGLDGRPGPDLSAVLQGEAPTGSREGANDRTPSPAFSPATPTHPSQVGLRLPMTPPAVVEVVPTPPPQPPLPDAILFPPQEHEALPTQIAPAAESRLGYAPRRLEVVMVARGRAAGQSGSFVSSDTGPSTPMLPAVGGGAATTGAVSGGTPLYLRPTPRGSPSDASPSNGPAPQEEAPSYQNGAEENGAAQLRSAFAPAGGEGTFTVCVYVSPLYPSPFEVVCHTLFLFPKGIEYLAGPTHQRGGSVLLFLPCHREMQCSRANPKRASMLKSAAVAAFTLLLPSSSSHFCLSNLYFWIFWSFLSC